MKIIIKDSDGENNVVLNVKGNHVEVEPFVAHPTQAFAPAKVIDLRPLRRVTDKLKDKAIYCNLLKEDELYCVSVEFGALEMRVYATGERYLLVVANRALPASVRFEEGLRFGKLMSRITQAYRNYLKELARPIREAEMRR